MKVFKFICIILFFGSVSSQFHFKGEQLQLRDERSKRVTGGNQANLGDLPFFAHLIIFNESFDDVECGGSFIRFNFVLTVSKFFCEDSLLY